MKVFLARAGIAKPQTWGEAVQFSSFMWYQTGMFLMLNLAEDPAWLAWGFC
jgi:hypothetical protein